MSYSSDAQKPVSSGRFSRLGLIFLACTALLLFLSASWVLAYRLLNGPGNSFFTYGYVGDEYLYAQRIQPLVDGATRTNTINGFTDPTLLSPFYLEDLCRWVLNTTGLDVLSFMWILRWIFPPLLALAFLPLIRQALPDRHRTWTKPLRLACWALSIVLIYLIYDLATEFPPLQGFIQRIPTNIEYPLSFLLAWSCVAFLKTPDYRRAFVLGGISTVMIYLRLYAAIPWGLMISSMLLIGLARRELSWKPCLAAVALVLAGCMPWVYVALHNGASEIYRQMLHRYFPPVPFAPHPQWKLMLAIAESMAILAWATPRWRSYMLGCTAALLILPFICSSLPVARELMNYDRFGVFYLVALVTCGLLWLGERQLQWRGKAGTSRALKWSAAVSSLALAGALLLVVRNSLYPLEKYPAGPLKYIQKEQHYIPAYFWLREHSPENSLVLLDDGSDWSVIAQQGKVGENIDTLMARDDLFQITARRRLVYTNRLFTVAISDEMLGHATALFLGTFGMTESCTAERYKIALEAMTPDYIFWRRTAPIPRGFGVSLQPHCKTVYSDEHCQIWKLDRQSLLAAIHGKG